MTVMHETNFLLGIKETYPIIERVPVFSKKDKRLLLQNRN